MKKKLNITVLVDIAEIPSGDPDFLIVPEKPSTEYYVIQALRALGYNVSVMGIEDNIEETITNLKEQHPDIVFNLTEHLGGDRNFDNISRHFSKCWTFRLQGPAQPVFC